MNLSLLKSLPLKKYIVSFLMAFTLTLFILAVICLVFVFLPPSQGVLDFMCDYSTTFSAFIASVICAFRCGKRGFLTGMLSAAVYTLIILGLGGIVFGKYITVIKLLKELMLSAVAGTVGGIIGINCK